MGEVRVRAERVVVAVDFQDDWEKAIDHAAALVARSRGRATLLHVETPPNWLLGRVLPADELGQVTAANAAEAERRIDAAIARHPEQGQLDRDVRTGRPAVEIVERLKALDADVLVLGMGEPVGTTPSLGPTADRLFRVSPVPVYVTGPRAPTPLRRILVPTALGPAGANAIRCALDLVDPGGTVYALHMVALPSTLRSWPGDIMELRRRLEEEAKRALDAHLEGIAVPANRTLVPLSRTNLELVPADKTILKEARERDVDLISFALGGRELPPGMLVGRVSEKVVRALPCPLLALPDTWADPRPPEPRPPQD